MKDDYNLDFLGLSDEHTERELEDALVLNITRFLQEMGGYCDLGEGAGGRNRCVDLSETNAW